MSVLFYIAGCFIVAFVSLAFLTRRIKGSCELCGEQHTREEHWYNLGYRAEVKNSKLRNKRVRTK